MFRFAYANQNTASASAACAEAASCLHLSLLRLQLHRYGRHYDGVHYSARLPSLPFPFWYWFFWPILSCVTPTRCVAEHFFQAIQQSGSAGIGGTAFLYKQTCQFLNQRRYKTMKKKFICACSWRQPMTLSMAACGSKGRRCEQRRQCRRRIRRCQTFTVGTSGPLTGDNAIYGVAVKQGVELAINEINAATAPSSLSSSQDDEADGENPSTPTTT